MTFSTPPRCFLGDRECFAYDAVSWKLFAGTFRTNLSQVRLETYLVGLAMDSLKRQARWNQRLDFLWHKEMRFRPSTCGTESFATEKRMFGPKMSNALDCHDSRHLYKPSAGSCLHKPGHTKDEGWNYRLAVPHLKLQMKLVDLLRCRLGGWALGKNRSDYSFPPEQRQIHEKQKWSLEFCCWSFHAQIHKALAQDSPLTSMYYQGTEASLLERRRFMVSGVLGFPDPPNTTYLAARHLKSRFRSQ